MHFACGVHHFNGLLVDVAFESGLDGYWIYFGDRNVELWNLMRTEKAFVYQAYIDAL